ncbi:MAG: tRNA U34 carboxymethyltransferase [marine bacterium B5-7]|nr:MAG: tRNA U34 carboxymethyltransferase [marine bacterium B5-7]
MFESDSIVAGTALGELSDTLGELGEQAVARKPHGDLSQWRDSLAKLPDIIPADVSLDKAIVRAGRIEDVNDNDLQRLEGALRSLMPWRKGPFEICGVRIDTEWRSDMKWSRFEKHITPLDDRLVLDVGCGSGYHCLRMAGAGARAVLGIEPMQLFVSQFQAINRYTRCPNVRVLPLTLEEMPTDTQCFDSVFSMGVLYHRRAPLDHLRLIKNCLRPGGELILETLIVDGDASTVLMPNGRYARMRNVWFIPSVAMLEIWLERSGFCDLSVIDVSTTTSDEQRQTEWMNYDSLSHSLDPLNSERTVEGYPAPRRAIIIARLH